MYYNVPQAKHCKEVKRKHNVKDVKENPQT